jgi:hypothetical protein
MPAKAIVSVEGNLRSLASTDPSLADSREPMDAAAMAEMLYQGFEQGVEELAQRGVSMPPPTDMNGRPMPGYEGQMFHASSAGAGGYRQGAARPVSQNEQAISTLVDVRDDMLRQYASVSQDPTSSSRIAMSIQKIESQIISMGGDIERFDPSKYRSGLRPVAQAADPMAAASKVVENTRQVYAEYPIKEIFAGKNKSGKAGICIKLACTSGGKDVTIHGTVVPKVAFSGNEAIDFVVDSGKGRMSVKSPNRGVWEDVSAEYDVAWEVAKEA